MRSVHAPDDTMSQNCQTRTAVSISKIISVTATCLAVSAGNVVVIAIDDDFKAIKLRSSDRPEV